MIKEIFVDEKKKNSLKKTMQKTSSSYKGLRNCLNIMRLLVYLVPAAFLGYAYFISTGFVQLHDRYAPIGTKNHLFIVTVTIVILILMLFFKMIIKTIYVGLVAKSIKEKFNETLIYNDGVLEYGYQNYMQATLFDRVIVKIPIDTLDKVEYVVKEKKFIFTGDISSLYYENYEKMSTRGKENFVKSQFEIIDYFSPTLESLLKEVHVNIVKR